MSTSTTVIGARRPLDVALLCELRVLELMSVLVRVMENRKRRKNAALKEIYARMQAERGEKTETPDVKGPQKKQQPHKMSKV